MCVKLKVNKSVSMGVGAINDIKESMKIEYMQSEHMIRHISDIKKTINTAPKMFKFMYETWAKDKKKEQNMKSINEKHI
jgi:hypothetical protein